VLLSLLGIKGFDHAMAVLSFVSSFEAKRDMFAQLANLQLPSKSTEIAKLHEDLNTIGKRRNVLIHGRYSGFSWSPLTLGVQRYDSRKKVFGVKNHFYTVEKLQNFVNSIEDAGIKLGKLKWEINALLYEKKKPESSDT